VPNRDGAGTTMDAAVGQLVTESKQFAVWLERDAGPGRLAFVMACTDDIRSRSETAMVRQCSSLWRLDKAGRRAAAAQILKKRRFSICVPSLERQCRAAHRGNSTKGMKASMSTPRDGRQRASLARSRNFNGSRVAPRVRLSTRELGRVEHRGTCEWPKRRAS